MQPTFKFNLICCWRLLQQLLCYFTLQVRDLWKQFDDFCTREASEREVIESIVDKTMNKYKISASDVNIKVPDMLLTECEDEIRKVGYTIGMLC